MRARAVLVIAAVLASSAATLAACADDDASDGGADGGSPDATASADGARPDAAGTDSDAPPADAGSDARDAASRRDANGPGTADASCSFNHDCQLALRCECDEVAGCACQPGARGTGKNGVDTCTDGNDCESAVCLEGPNDVLYCSDECATPSDCGGVLPVCADIAFVGRICIRDAGQ